ncbi:cytochrome d ubiquinol oxidase subunit II [Georgenia subflava]|uniref:Cytochrome d ubiquinol oxidase subunit II n=1 Tax=Georgenia subflava TaxID=1622177 RepID=A0A6N7EML5_9MICO|nr:cytochrome d ubiquinol oxidase subunit II [Georgenia subflava]
MPTLWFALIVLCWVLFFVLEGFDFGVGILAPALGRDTHQRGAALATIGPVWDGNEVWLVAAIGATFAAFPNWYAALLSGLYLPMVIILLALAGRGVALEFRGKKDDAAWRRRCDQALATCSLLSAAAFGAVLGVLPGGLAIGPDGEVVADAAGALARTLGVLAQPGALLGAGAGVVVACLLGGAYLALRTTGPVRERARALVPPLAAVLAALVVLGGLTGTVGWLPAAAAVALLVLVTLAARYRREGWAFGICSVLVATVVVVAFAASVPVLLPSTLDPAWSLTLQGAAASDTALSTITVAGVVILPGVLAYQAFAYWVFRRRVTSERAAT